MVNNLLHSILVSIATLIGYIFGYELIVVAGAIWFFIGRELAQAEYRWIEHYGSGLRANMKWYSAFEPKVWDLHSFWWNLVLPILVAFSLVYIFN